MGALGRALGLAIRQARCQKGITQSDLGGRLPLPVSHAAISDIERGKTSVSLDSLAELAAALGLPVERLLVDALDRAEENG